jgi:hypothetical protein
MAPVGVTHGSECGAQGSLLSSPPMPPLSQSMPIKLQVPHHSQEFFGMFEATQSRGLDSGAARLVISESSSAEDSMNPIHADRFAGLLDTVTPVDLESPISTYDVLSDLERSDDESNNVSFDMPSLELPRRARNTADI